MIRRIILGLLFAIAATPALAQNTTCSDRSPTDNSNACANTRFVQSHVPPGSGAGGTNGQIQYNNAGSFGGFTANGDATINTSTGQVAVSKINGVPVTTTGSTTNDVLAYNGTSYIHTALNSVINTLCTASPTTCVSLFGYGIPQWWGAVCDGITNDAVALQNAINASAGKSLYIPPGPACVSSVTLTLPSNTAITGGGRDVSTLKSSANPAISITNQSNISLSNFQILGTNAVTQWTTSTSGPVFLSQNGSATSAGMNFSFTGMKFSGFNSSYWFLVSTQGSTFPLINLTISNNQFVSVAANIPADPNHVNNTNYFITLYSNTGGNGQIQSLDINNNYMDANSMCFGILDFANTFKFRINNNTILNPGVTAPTNHCTNGLNATNAYGISVYDLNGDGNPATSGEVSSNYIFGAQASGIYWVGNSASTTLAANAASSSITNNLISNEAYSDTLLPRGAIVVASTTQISIIGNTGYQNATCVNLHGQTAGEVSVQSNHCESNAGSAIGLQLSALVSGTSNASRLDILSNYFSAPTAVQYQSSSTGKFNEVSLANNTLIGSTANLSAANQFFIGTNNFSNNSMRGAGTSDVSGQTGGNTLLFNNLGFGMALATGVAAPVSGSSVYISDANVTTNPCTGGGTGAMAIRQVGKWVCY